MATPVEVCSGCFQPLPRSSAMLSGLGYNLQEMDLYYNRILYSYLKMRGGLLVSGERRREALFLLHGGVMYLYMCIMHTDHVWLCLAP